MDGFPQDQFYIFYDSIYVTNLTNTQGKTMIEPGPVFN